MSAARVPRLEVIRVTKRHEGRTVLDDVFCY